MTKLVRVVKDFELYAVSFVNHEFHGPWETKDGICRGCGVGFFDFDFDIDANLPAGHPDIKDDPWSPLF